MKVTKIPGLGRFGVFIDDVDLNTISHDEWMEIGKLHLEQLVTIIRGNNIDYKKYWDLITAWGPSRYNRPLNLYLKYGKKVKDLLFNNELDEADRQAVMNARQWQMDRRCDGVVRVTGKKDWRGKTMGVFGDGELKWHSNECGTTIFAPGVALMGWESMKGSATGFLTTTDYYESLSESFRSELDQMIVVHNYQSASINPTKVPEQESFYQDNQCPQPDGRVPLIIKSPGGIKGIHLGIAAFDYVEGMSKEESKKLFDRLQKEMFVDKYIYDHWYQGEGDICLFDNSITLHRRVIENNGTSPNRVGLRIQYDFDNLAGTYMPYYQDEFNQERLKKIEMLHEAMS